MFDARYSIRTHVAGALRMSDVGETSPSPGGFTAARSWRARSSSTCATAAVSSSRLRSRCIGGRIHDAERVRPEGCEAYRHRSAAA